MRLIVGFDPGKTAILGRTRPPVLASVSRGETLMVGRSKQADVRIDHKRVASEHLLVGWEAGRWMIRDLKTATGTFSNGYRINELDVEAGVNQVVVNLGAINGPRLFAFLHDGVF